MFNSARSVQVVIATRHLLPGFSQQPRAVTQSRANGSLGYPTPTDARLAEPPDSILPPSQDWSGNEAREPPLAGFSFSCFSLSPLSLSLRAPPQLLLRVTQPPLLRFPRERGRAAPLKPRGGRKAGASAVWAPARACPCRGARRDTEPRSVRPGWRSQDGRRLFSRKC